MSNFTVCARFRPLSSSESRDSVCINSFDDETFSLKDEREGEFKFSFDKVFYEESEQLDVYTFLALPIVRDAVNGINGAIITYGQTGAGKTYSMEGPNILELEERKKGLLSRVIAGIFEDVNSSEESVKFMIKLSMVQIYMEKLRDLLHPSKDNVQIEESKSQGILLSGVRDVALNNSAGALQILLRGISNRAAVGGETQMNMASSRSHCVYIITIQQETVKDKRTKCGKLVLVDLAGSEKVEETGAEEASKTIDKSFSALGDIVYAVTCGGPGRANDIPYRDSKLTQIIQDALGGNYRAALLCCCSPSTYNASETLSTLRFGARYATCARANHIKAAACVSSTTFGDNKCRGILDKLRDKLRAEDVKLVEELFVGEGLIGDLNSVEGLKRDSWDATPLMETVDEFLSLHEEHERNLDIIGRQLEVLGGHIAQVEEEIAHVEVIERPAPAGLWERFLNLLWALLQFYLWFIPFY